MSQSVDITFPILMKDDLDAEGVLATWFVQDGQAVKEGQVIAEVQVEKVAADVTAPVSGTVTLLVAEQASVLQGAVIARLVPA